MWLKENAKDYGFVMRYPEEKAEITGVSYEPWHWRYVGKEHSYKMDELGMCLEEYIEYIEYLETDLFDKKHKLIYYYTVYIMI